MATGVPLARRTPQAVIEAVGAHVDVQTLVQRFVHEYGRGVAPETLFDPAQGRLRLAAMAPEHHDLVVATLAASEAHLQALCEFRDDSKRSLEKWAKWVKWRETLHLGLSLAFAPLFFQKPPNERAQRIDITTVAIKTTALEASAFSPLEMLLLRLHLRTTVFQEYVVSQEIMLLYTVYMLLLRHGVAKDVAVQTFLHHSVGSLQKLPTFNDIAMPAAVERDYKSEFRRTDQKAGSMHYYFTPDGKMPATLAQAIAYMQPLLTCANFQSALITLLESNGNALINNTPLLGYILPKDVALAWVLRAQALVGSDASTWLARAGIYGNFEQLDLAQFDQPKVRTYEPARDADGAYSREVFIARTAPSLMRDSQRAWYSNYEFSREGPFIWCGGAVNPYFDPSLSSAEREIVGAQALAFSRSVARRNAAFSQTTTDQRKRKGLGIAFSMPWHVPLAENDAATKALFADATATDPESRQRAVARLCLWVKAHSECLPLAYALRMNEQGERYVDPQRLQQLMQIDAKLVDAMAQAHDEARKELSRVAQFDAKIGSDLDLLQQWSGGNLARFFNFASRHAGLIQAACDGILSPEERRAYEQPDLYLLNPASAVRDFPAFFLNAARSRSWIRDTELSAVLNQSMQQMALRNGWLVESSGEVRVTLEGALLAPTPTPAALLQKILRRNDAPAAMAFRDGEWKPLNLDAFLIAMPHQGVAVVTAEQDGVLDVTPNFRVSAAGRIVKGERYVVMQENDLLRVVPMARFFEPAVFEGFKDPLAIELGTFSLKDLRSGREAEGKLDARGHVTFKSTPIVGGVALPIEVDEANSPEVVANLKRMQALLSATGWAFSKEPVLAQVVHEPDAPRVRYDESRRQLVFNAAVAAFREPFKHHSAEEVRWVTEALMVLPTSLESSEPDVQRREQFVRAAQYNLAHVHGDPDFILAHWETLHVRRDARLREIYRYGTELRRQRIIAARISEFLCGPDGALEKILAPLRVKSKKDLQPDEAHVLHAESHHAIDSALEHMYRDGRIGLAFSSSAGRAIEHPALFEPPHVVGVYAFRVPLEHFRVKSLAITSPVFQRWGEAVPFLIGVYYHGKHWLFDERTGAHVPTAFQQQLTAREKLEANLGLNLKPFFPQVGLPESESRFRLVRIESAFKPEGVIAKMMDALPDDTKISDSQAHCQAALHAWIDYTYPEWRDISDPPLLPNLECVRMRRDSEIERLERGFVAVTAAMEAATPDVREQTAYLNDVAMPYLRLSATRHKKLLAAFPERWSEIVFADLSRVKAAAEKCLQRDLRQGTVRILREDLSDFCGLEGGALLSALQFFYRIAEAAPDAPLLKMRLVDPKTDTAVGEVSAEAAEKGISAYEPLFSGASKVLAEFHPAVGERLFDTLMSEARANLTASGDEAVDRYSRNYVEMLASLMRQVRFIGQMRINRDRIRGPWAVGSPGRLASKRQHGEVHFAYETDIGSLHYFVEMRARPDRYFDGERWLPRTIRLEIYRSASRADFERERLTRINRWQSFRLEESEDAPGRMHFNLQGHVEGEKGVWWPENHHDFFKGPLNALVDGDFTACCERFINNVLWFRPGEGP